MDSEAMGIVRGRLIAASPWLATAFGRLAAEEIRGLERPGTDGTRFFHDPARLRRDLAGGSAALAHCASHCLLGHPFMRDPDALAADMAAALLTDALLPEFCPARGAELFMQARHHLEGVPLGGVAGAMARDPFFAEHREALRRLLTVDDHRFWRPERGLAARASGENGGWEDLRRRVLGEARGGRRGRAPGDAVKRYAPGRVPERSYRDLLAAYAGEVEELREDPDGFEPGLYCWGLERGAPIVEPLETRQARRVDELAVVIDTSGSCLETLTTRFLDETRALLADEALFARRFNLRILQCDARVRRDDVITCVRDFERYIDGLTLVGGGGTDFRPAFERIDRLVARGAFRRLRAALFFSDGMGLFPPRSPEYDAIFVFFKGHYDAIDVPSWARTLVLEGD
ncbi:MAG: VWA-like domain-containing protein [Clostridia bacterium]|nr:VWA-like domain-containing protein [Clostridia bacterium]